VLRIIRDHDGVSWRVWAVLPIAIESHRIIDKTTGVDRLPLPPELAGGWMAFESAGGERRRIGPLPEGWETLDDASLLAALDRAARVSTPSSSLPGLIPEWRPAPPEAPGP
jgi:hypothetical protein